MFTKSSRYYPLRDLTYRDPAGKERVYKERRLVRGELPVRGRTTIARSERLDLVADRALGSAERFWILCDANRIMNPFELSGVSGRTLAIPEV